MSEARIAEPLLSTAVVDGETWEGTVVVVPLRVMVMESPGCRLPPRARLSALLAFELAVAADVVFEELLATVRRERLAALVATHNPDLAARMDRTVHLKDGVLSA